MYRHLNRETREIRLIRLIKDTSQPSPGSWEFETKYASLDSNDLTPYTAFSYVWGKPDPGKYRVSLGQSIIGITPNLHAAIDTLSRLEDLAHQWIWIDAICINQGDLDERAFQVRLMRDLYSRAQRTIAYLGPGNDDVELGLHWLERLNDAITLPQPLQWLVSAAESPQNDHSWRSLNSIIDRQWWTRAWILQETVMSPNLVFMYGKKIVPEKVVVDAFRFLKTLPYDICNALLARGILVQGWSAPFNAVYKRFVLRYWYQERQRLTIGSIITYRYQFHASDPRDYVYALFGLIEHTDGRLANPNYTIPVWQAYASLVVDYSKVYDNIDILCLAGAPRKLQGLPSWAPDLAVKMEPDCTYYHEDSLWLINLDAEASLQEQNHNTSSLEPSPMALFRASGRAKHDVSFSEDLKTLSLSAVCVDSIDGIAGYQHVVSTETGFMTRTSFVSSSLQPEKTVSAYGTVEATREAIWRTMLFDRLEDFLVDPAPDYAAALIVYGFINAEAGRGDSRWKGVWNAMKDFQVAGISLRDWFCDEADLHAIETRAREAMRLHLERLPSRKVQAGGLDNPAISTCVHKLLEMQRHMFVTNEGYVGMAPLEAKRGDEVWILRGCSIPVLLRKLNDKHWQVVGECYIHGFMYGEALQHVNEGKRVVSTIVLT